MTPGFFGLNWSDPNIDQVLVQMANNLYYEVIYLAEALHFGFWDVWNMPTTMRRKFIEIYEEILEKRREKEERDRIRRSTGMSH